MGDRPKHSGKHRLPKDTVPQNKDKSVLNARVAGRKYKFFARKTPRWSDAFKLAFDFSSKVRAHADNLENELKRAIEIGSITRAALIAAVTRYGEEQRSSVTGAVTAWTLDLSADLLPDSELKTYSLNVSQDGHVLVLVCKEGKDGKEQET